MADLAAAAVGLPSSKRLFQEVRVALPALLSCNFDQFLEIARITAFPGAFNDGFTDKRAFKT